MADEKPDMENRDPNDINQHVKVKFEDVLGEPDGIRSIDCVWRVGYACFTGGLSCCYKTLTVLCGLPMALSWGCQFACLACQEIWQCTPYIQMLQIRFFNTRKCVLLCADACVGPCCETLGLFFSKIAVKTT